MPERRFLMWLLTGIFVVQACTFGVGFIFCARNGGLKSCPELGDRYEGTFAVMIATTLALLTGKQDKSNDVQTGRLPIERRKATQIEGDQRRSDGMS